MAFASPKGIRKYSNCPSAVTNAVFGIETTAIAIWRNPFYLIINDLTDRQCAAKSNDP